MDKQTDKPTTAYEKLTLKQQRFVDYYDGNATQAAKIAGYKSPTIQGHENLRKPNIIEALKTREDRRKKGHIATREERQQFWSDMMKGAEKDADKLKASELLGRSEADFTDKIQGTGEITLKIVKYGD